VGVIDELRKAEPNEYLLAGALFLSTIAPGFIVLLVYSPEHIEKLEFTKLLFFTFAIGSPLLAVTLALLALFSRQSDVHLLRFFCMVAAVVSFIVTYPLLYVAFIFKLTLVHVIWIFILINLVVCFFLGSGIKQGLHSERE